MSYNQKPKSGISRFEGRIEKYDAYRPSYPREVIDIITGFVHRELALATAMLSISLPPDH
jgi:hypothetical protein